MGAHEQFSEAITEEGLKELESFFKEEDMAPSNEKTLSDLVNEKQKLELEPQLTRKQRREIERKLNKLNRKNK